MRDKIKKLKGKTTFFQDFKRFISRGNVVDMTVGVIVGGAFSKITASVVNDVVMPLISLILGRMNISELSATLREAEYNEAGEITANAVTLNYGMFIQSVIDFLVIAMTIFIAIRLVGKFRAKMEEQLRREEKTAAEPDAATVQEPAREPSSEELLLAEIRDILKNRDQHSSITKQDAETS